jgi:hypothetical protein
MKNVHNSGLIEKRKQLIHYWSYTGLILVTTSADYKDHFTRTKEFNLNFATKNATIDQWLNNAAKINCLIYSGISNILLTMQR